MTISSSSSSSSSSSTGYQFVPSTEIKRIDPEKKLNAFMSLVTPEETFLWTSERIEAIHWKLPKSEQEKLTENKIKDIREKSNNFNLKYSDQRESRVKSIGHTMDAKRYLFYCVVEIVKELSLNISDDTEIQEKLEKFKNDFAKLRYSADEDQENLKNCTLFIEELLEDFNLIGQGNCAVQLKPYLELCSYLLQCDDLLEVSLGNLFSNNDIKQDEFSIQMLTESFYYSSQMLLQETERVLSFIQKDLKPFLNKTQHVLLSSEQIWPWLKKKKDSILKMSHKLCLRDPESIVLSQQKIIELGTEISSLTKPYYLSQKERTLANTHKHLNIFKAMLKTGRKNDIDDEEKIDWNNLLQTEFYIKFDVNLGKHTISEFELFVEFQEKLFKWHLLVDAFVSPHMNAMKTIFTALHTWHKENKRDIERLLKIYHTPTIQQSVDDLMKFINSGDSKKSTYSNKKERGIKKTGKIKKQPAKLVTTKPETVTVSPAPVIKVAANPKESKALTIDEKVFQGLKKIILSSSTDKIERTAARQALVSLQDIQAMVDRFKAKEVGETQSTLALNTLMTIQATYYHMEQSLRLENLKMRIDQSSRLAFHNLQHQATPLGRQHEQIVYNLRMVNAWVPDTYHQINKWGSLRMFRGQEPPKALSEIYDVLEFPLEASVTVHKLQKYLKDTLVFTGFFYSGISQLSESEKPSFFSMQDNVSFNCIPLQAFANKVDKNFLRSTQSASSPLNLTLKQISTNLKTLTSILTELNCEHVSSKEFSFFIRQAFYWQGQVMEKMMHAILLKNLGEDWKKEHNLHYMHKKIFTHPSKNSAMLENVWKQWHNITRYPYESSESLSPIHSMILAAEVLRDMPHLGEGYIFQELGTHFRDKQHFIPVSKKLLNTKAITNELAEVYQGFLDLVKNELIKKLL
jgi:hypothetical protein